MVFLWVFLPSVIFIYFLLKKEYRNLFLLLASLIFYAWGEPVYILLMLVSIGINYTCGLLVDCTGGTKRKLMAALAVVLNLLLLGYFKYANFLVDSLNCLKPGLIRDFGRIALPIGISFYTFQAMSYVIDVYRKDCRVQKNPLTLGLYITCFPQLIAGPIVKYHDVAVQLENRNCSLHDFSMGIRRFVFGMAKKVLIANPLAAAADQIFGLVPSSLGTSIAWLGAICYTFQIYYDFSGYSDMAIGLGRMFGFRFPENFNYPYLTRSIKEFWTRWHISLSTWFKEYLYIPLGGEPLRQCTDLSEPDHSLSGDRDLAWRSLDVSVLGNLSRMFHPAGAGVPEEVSGPARLGAAGTCLCHAGSDLRLGAVPG